MKPSRYLPKEITARSLELSNLQAEKRAKAARAEQSGMPRKKKGLGQHFLRKQSTVDNMIEKVIITPETSVMEIGCGDGFLTRAILAQTKCKQLRCFEIDHEWATFVRKAVTDPRLTIKLQNILDMNWAEELADGAPWVLLANLPYNITFPILFLLQKNKQLFQEGVVMVQEEVGQKIVSNYGRSYNPTSMFLQYHFVWQLMEKIEPGAFTPPPKVHSRLLYFKPRYDQAPIPHEEKFWAFLKLCFKSPRQTLRNNLKSTHYYTRPGLPESIMQLRAQQMSFDDFLQVWQVVGPQD